jgi:hypothetical protein
MTARLSDVLLKTTLMALAFACATLLLRDSMAIGLSVPLDPNEGWNAYHALAAMTGAPLYPRGLMVNNYPPLSFYIVGLLGRGLGDNIVAGRLVSLLSLLAIGMGLTSVLRQIGGRVLDGIFAGLLFTAAILIASDYAAMDDPQLLGQALQIEALLLLFREKPPIFFVSLLCVAGIFVKHNLASLPLAMFVWLLLENRQDALRFAGYGIGLALAGLVAVWVFLGANLLAEIAAPRVWQLANLVQAMMHYLTWAGLPLVVTAGLGWRFRRDPWMQFCLIYGGIALLLGTVFSAGDGVDANIFFDLDIALALAAGLALKLAPGRWAGALGLAYAAPLGLFLARNFSDNNFTYTEAFQKQAPLDIAFLEVNAGPALCENLSLCYWAGKEASVDVFNIAEEIKTGKRRDDELVHLFETRFFRGVQLDSWTPFALGPRARAALAAHYRINHVDDNGVFLISAAPRP